MTPLPPITLMSKKYINRKIIIMTIKIHLIMVKKNLLKIIIIMSFKIHLIMVKKKLSTGVQIGMIIRILNQTIRG